METKSGCTANIPIICHNILIPGEYPSPLRDQFPGGTNPFNIHLSKMNENIALEWYCPIKI